MRVPGRDTVLEINFETGKARAEKPIPIGLFARLVGRFMVNLPEKMSEELRTRLTRE